MFFPLGYFWMPGLLEMLVIAVILGIVVGLPLLVVVLLLIVVPRQSQRRAKQAEMTDAASRGQRSTDG